MKKFKLSTVLAIISICLLSVVFSCHKTKDIDKSFYGGIVVGRCQNGWPEYFLTIKKADSTFVTMKVYPSYYELYQAGDTIK